MSIIRRVEFLTSCAFTVLLAACGGGGGDAADAGSGTKITITAAPGGYDAATSATGLQDAAANASVTDVAEATEPDAADAASPVLDVVEVATPETHATDTVVTRVPADVAVNVAADVVAEAAADAPVEATPDAAAAAVTDPTADTQVAKADEPVAQAAVERPTRSIAALDVMASARSDTPLSTQTWDYQCYGQNKSARAIPLLGVIGDTLVEAPRMRLGLEKAQAADSTRGIVLRTASTDPMTAGAPRCEVSFTRSTNSFLPREKDFWFASRIWIDDWSASTDEQLIMQFHAGDSSQNLGPFFALYVRGNRARAALRFDTQAAAQTLMGTRASNDLWSGPVTFARRWATVVVQARISTDAAKGPFLRFWIDGQLLGQHVGPVGYNGTGSDYAKLGFYHWLSGNAWDTNVPVRTMYVSRSMLVSDPSQTYTEADLRAAVE